MDKADRILAEVELVRLHFPGVVVDLPWMMIPEYELPNGIWHPDVADLSFRFPDNYPDQAPYAFYLRPVTTLTTGSPPGNTASSSDPPFGVGSWTKFSWQPERWVAASEPRLGSNMLAFVRSFRTRLDEAN